MKYYEATINNLIINWIDDSWWKRDSLNIGLKNMLDEWKYIENWDKNNEIYYDEYICYDTSKPDVKEKLNLRHRDIIYNCYTILSVSEKVKKLLEDYWINNWKQRVQFLPIRYLDLDTKTKEVKWYYLLNILNLLEHAVDNEKSVDNTSGILDNWIIKWEEMFRISKIHSSYFILSEDLKNYLESSWANIEMSCNEIYVETENEKEFYEKYYREKWIKIWLLTNRLFYFIKTQDIDREYYFSYDLKWLWDVLKYIKYKNDEILLNFIEKKYSKSQKVRLNNVLNWTKAIKWKLFEKFFRM